MDYPTYPPDLALCEFSLFPKLRKNALKGQRFADISDIQHNVTLVRGIPENDFQDCFRQWHHRLKKCTASQGDPGIKLSHHVLGGGTLSISLSPPPPKTRDGESSKRFQGN
jgi:hypothetical protein